MMVVDFSDILKALDREHVKFLLVGGVAAIGHGMTHSTNDIDICYERSPINIAALVRALSPSKPKLRTRDGAVPFLFDEKAIANGINFTLDTDWGWVDLLGEVTGIGVYADFASRAAKVDYRGITVDIISLDDLILAKKAAGRTKDKLHLLELEAIWEILKKTPD